MEQPKFKRIATSKIDERAELALFREDGKAGKYFIDSNSILREANPLYVDFPTKCSSNISLTAALIIQPYGSVPGSTCCGKELIAKAEDENDKTLSIPLFQPERFAPRTWKITFTTQVNGSWKRLSTLKKWKNLHAHCHVQITTEENECFVSQCFWIYNQATLPCVLRGLSLIQTPIKPLQEIIAKAKENGMHIKAKNKALRSSKETFFEKWHNNATRLLAPRPISPMFNEATLPMANESHLASPHQLNIATSLLFSPTSPPSLTAQPNSPSSDGVTGDSSWPLTFGKRSIYDTSSYDTFVPKRVKIAQPTPPKRLPQITIESRERDFASDYNSAYRVSDKPSFELIQFLEEMEIHVSFDAIIPNEPIIITVVSELLLDNCIVHLVSGNSSLCSARLTKLKFGTYIAELHIEPIYPKPQTVQLELLENGTLFYTKQLPYREMHQKQDESETLAAAQQLCAMANPLPC